MSSIDIANWIIFAGAFAAAAGALPAAGTLRLSTLIIFAGAFAAAAGALWSSTLQAKLQAAESEIRAAEAKKSEEAEKALRIKSEEIANLNHRIVDLVTGGNTYGRVYIGPSWKGSSTYTAYMQVKGDTPLLDVSVAIRNIDQFRLNRKKGVRAPDAYEAATTVYNLGTLIPKLSRTICNLELPVDANEVHYQMDIYARNGLVTQVSHGKLTANGWVFHDTLTRNGNILFDKKSRDFPSDSPHPS